jgi:hypothetical protein
MYAHAGHTQCIKKTGPGLQFEHDYNFKKYLWNQTELQANAQHFLY